jgi:hypothetical protein
MFAIGTTFCIFVATETGSVGTKYAFRVLVGKISTAKAIIIMGLQIQLPY